MEYKVAWLKEEDHDEYWDDPLHWNRTSVEVDGEDPSRRKLEEKIAQEEKVGEEDVVIMQTTK